MIQHTHRKYAISVILLAFIACVYLFSAIKPSTPYNYFILLAQQLHKGKYYLEESYPWLNELVPSQDGRFFVVYPPMPAIISLPFILLGNTSQTEISIFIGICNIILLFLVTLKLYGNKNALLLMCAFALGTNHWYLATEGSSWYFSHICAVFCILLSLFALEIKQKNNRLEVTNKMSRWLVTGLFIGAAYWSRLPNILIIPLFFYLSLQMQLNWKATAKRLLVFLIGCSIFVVLNFYYNFVRFDTILDHAYYQIPGVLEEAWYTKGIFDLSYLPGNLQFFFAKFPLLHTSFPYVKPSLEGMALWLTSPFFLLLLCNNHRKKWTLVLLFTGILMMVPGLLHGTVGFSQFGYRFGLEGSILMLIALGTVFKRKLLKLAFSVLLILSILINFWGIYFIRVLHTTGW